MELRRTAEDLRESEEMNHRLIESHIAARGIIVSESGSHFDPLIVQAFENCCDTFRAIAGHGPTDHQMAA